MQLRGAFSKRRKEDRQWIKGKGWGGGSPACAKPKVWKAGDTPPLGRSLYPFPSEGWSPFICERGRYRMAETGTGSVSPARRANSTRPVARRVRPYTAKN